MSETFALKPVIKPHPRLTTGVVFEVLRDNFAIECGVVVKETLEKSVAAAKERILNLFPDLNLDGIYVHLSDGR